MKQKVTKDFKFSSPEQSPGFLLWQLHTIWSRKINQVLKKFNITHVQFVIMANIKWLTVSKKLVTQIEIATLSNIDPVVISNVLKTLGSKQFVKRKPSQDTRFKEVKLTQNGIDVLTPALVEVETFDNNFFKSYLNINALTESLKTLIDNKSDK